MDAFVRWSLAQDPILAAREAWESKYLTFLAFKVGSCKRRRRRRRGRRRRRRETERGEGKVAVEGVFQSEIFLEVNI